MDWTAFAGICTLITVIGGVIVRDRAVMKTISEGDAKLHERINCLGKEFVSRDQMQQTIGQLTRTVEALSSEVRDTNKRIDQLLTMLARDS